MNIKKHIFLMALAAFAPTAGSCATGPGDAAALSKKSKTSKPKRRLSKAARIGIGVAAGVLGLAALGGSGALLYRLKQRRVKEARVAVQAVRDMGRLSTDTSPIIPGSDFQREHADMLDAVSEAVKYRDKWFRGRYELPGKVRALMKAAKARDLCIHPEFNADDNPQECLKIWKEVYPRDVCDKPECTRRQAEERAGYWGEEIVTFGGRVDGAAVDVSLPEASATVNSVS